VGTLGKIICIGFAAFYILGVLLYLIAPISRRFRPRLLDQDENKAKGLFYKGIE